MPQKISNFDQVELNRLNHVLDKLVEMKNPFARVLQQQIAGLTGEAQGKKYGAFYAWGYQLMTMMTLAMNTKLPPDQFADELDKLIQVQEVPHDSSEKQQAQDAVRKGLGPNDIAN